MDQDAGKLWDNKGGWSLLGGRKVPVEDHEEAFYFLLLWWASDKRNNQEEILVSLWSLT